MGREEGRLGSLGSLGRSVGDSEGRGGGVDVIVYANVCCGSEKKRSII